MRKNLVRRFFTDRHGNFAMMGAVLTVPLLAAAGLSIDYFQSVNIRSQLQNAADSAAIAAARTPSGADYAAAAQKIFEANSAGLRGITLSGGQTVRVMGADGWEYTYSVSFNMPTGLSGLIGIDQVAGAIDSTAIAGGEKVEIALVLDSTGSMNGQGKMVELKKAVRLFADEFSGMTNNVKMAVVPFDTQVRLQDVAFGSSVLDTPANPFTDATNCATLNDPDDRAACTEYKDAAAAATGCTATTDTALNVTILSDACVTVVNGVKYTETTVTTTTIAPPNVDVVVNNTSEPFAFGPKMSKPNDVITANNDLLGADAANWTGCVIDRAQPNDVNNASPRYSDPATLYPAAHCATANLAAVQPLTANMTTIKSVAASLQGSGNTNVSIGVQWGMEALTPEQPLTGASTAANVKRYMIVLTDGVNTQNRWTKNSAEIDARLTLACANAKANDITLYTVRLINGNASVLQACASSPDKYFDVQNANELSGVFGELAAKIKKVRIVS